MRSRKKTEEDSGEEEGRQRGVKEALGTAVGEAYAAKKLIGDLTPRAD
jgi:hypothetical protein